MASRERASATPSPSRIRALVDPLGPSSEPFRTLRVALELGPDSGRSNLILFTSADPDEGKSTIAANYAFVSAVNDRRVLLIDADLREPAQHEIFSLPRAPGLTEMIFSRLELHALTQPIRGVPGLHVLTAGTPSSRAGWDITGSNAVRDLLTRVSGEYDVVVVDTPPVLVAADAAHIAAHPRMNVVFVVTKDQGTRRLSRALAKLQLVDTNLLGFVVNREGHLSEYGYG